MQTESAFRRRWGQAFALGLLLDVALAGGLAYWLADEGQRTEASIYLFLGIQAVSIMLALKGTAWKWLSFEFGGRRFMTNAIYDGLRQQGLPAPERYERSPEAYLERIVNDESESTGVRLAAARELGALSSLSSSGGISLSIQLSTAFEDAMARMRGEEISR